MYFATPRKVSVRMLPPFGENAPMQNLAIYRPVFLEWRSPLAGGDNLLCSRRAFALPRPRLPRGDAGSFPVQIPDQSSDSLWFCFFVFGHITMVTKARLLSAENESLKALLTFRLLPTFPNFWSFIKFVINFSAQIMLSHSPSDAEDAKKTI